MNITPRDCRSAITDVIGVKRAHWPRTLSFATGSDACAVKNNIKSPSVSRGWVCVCPISDFFHSRSADTALTYSTARPSLFMSSCTATDCGPNLHFCFIICPSGRALIFNGRRAGNFKSSVRLFFLLFFYWPSFVPFFLL